MLGLMQDWPMLVTRMLTHAEVNHGQRELVGLLPEGGTFRYNYIEMAKRSRKCAQALERLGVKFGDRVATLAWNSHRHMEAWYGISGMGAVTHTVNPRLFAEQIVYIMNHAEDVVLMYDITFHPIVEKLKDEMKTVKHFICMVGEKDLPETDMTVLSYESLLDAEDGDLEWPTFDENTACGLCYTSGTTGNPKGVLYSHRSNFLHSLLALSADALGINSKTCILPVVPMFHANAWGIPYAACAAGAKIAFNGPHHDPETLQKYMIDEGVTFSAAVPTVWMGLLDHLEKNNLDCGKLESVTIGGAACPRFMIQAFQEKYGVRVNHAWGMTETSPLGTVGTENFAIADLNDEERLDYQCKQGRPVFCVELAIKDDEGNSQVRDGETSGRVMVRGPWVIKEYFRGDAGDILDDDGWFDTGDVANIDDKGYMQITDRSKDVIKSGGEWISSIDMENEAAGHPKVKEAAVIGVPHPKWNERPLLIIIPEDGETVTHEDMTEWLTGRIAKWWLPDATELVSEIPHTATGKISKKDLRIQFEGYKLPGA